MRFSQGREAPVYKSGVGGVIGKADRLLLAGSSNVSVGGWVVDSLLPKQGVGPVTVLVSVDEVCAAAFIIVAFLTSIS